MFIGRENELTKLNQLYKTNKFQMPVVYGRRRVGKTALISEFIKGKPSIFFTGIESSLAQNLESFSWSIFSIIEGSKNAPVFKSFKEAFEYIFEISLKERLVLVIDEYPYVVKADKSISSVLQSLIDKYLQESKLFIILCGSSMSFMEEQVLGYQSPLYGRRTGQFKILPFTYSESCLYFNKFSKMDMVYIYGITGGTPQYLLQMDDNLTVSENIKQNILDKNSYLFEEPNNLLKQEVREAALYNAIISAIARGSSKLSEISTKVNTENSACTACLKKLLSLGIVNKEIPFGENVSRKTIYILADNLFKFWYKFVLPNISLLQNDMIDVAYESIHEHLSTYMVSVFEEICKQYLWQQNKNKQLPFAFTQLGRWWGNDPREKSQTEIDIICADDNSSAIFCECKWTNEKVDIAVLNKLIYRSKLFKYENSYLYIFSKVGFTTSCSQLANELNNVKLIAFDDMQYKE